MLVEYTQLVRNAEIKRRRIALGLSQKELGEKVGLSGVYISHMETFRLRKNEGAIGKVAAFFGVDPEVIYPTWLREMKTFPSRVTLEIEATEAQFERLGEATQKQLASGCRVVEDLVIAEEEADQFYKIYAALSPVDKIVMKMYCEGCGVRVIAKKIGYRGWAAVQRRIVKNIAMFTSVLPEMLDRTAQDFRGLLDYAIGKREPTTVVRKNHKKGRSIGFGCTGDAIGNRTVTLSQQLINMTSAGNRRRNLR